MDLASVAWWVFAAIAAASAVGMVASRNPVHSAIFLAINFVSLAVIYLLLSAPVLFALQMIVYAGAIMVLFLFVVMFFNSPKAKQWMRPPLKWQVIVGGMVSLLFVVLFLAAAFYSQVKFGFGEKYGGGEELATFAATEQEMIGLPKALGKWMFSYHVLPFELIAILLLAALIGLVLVARDQVSEGRDNIPNFAPLQSAGSGSKAADGAGSKTDDDEDNEVASGNTASGGKDD